MEINLYEQFVALFESNKRLYWVYLLSSLAIATIYLMVFKNQKRVLLSKKLWLHPSAILDYKYFFISFFIKSLLIIPFIFGATEVAMGVYEILIGEFGFVKVSLLSYEMILFLYTLSLFIISDFTRYWLHRWLHTIPFLWEFHKVHHSPKVLNPMSFYRVHPIENILFALRYSLSIGAVTGVFLYFFGAYISILEILGANIFLFVFSLMGSNLRHSHIKLSYPKILENLFISPYQHQIHHSKYHTHKNYGGYLAIWDKFFGSLQYSKDVKKTHFGLGSSEQFNTTSKLLFDPFINLRRRYAK
jgi:sterol desaturase/sphingolipid hydroxylase (fatty acid hydroxylase superfamily)